MISITSYTLSIFLCVVCMICWGSWSNTQKLVQKSWRFELFYWDYVIGMLIAAFIAALTVGSLGDTGRTFFTDIKQVDTGSLLYALGSGALFNLGNLLLVAAIAVAGLSVAFPIGAGIAWIVGIGVNYIIEILDTGKAASNQWILFSGVAIIIAAIIVSAISYRRLSKETKKSSLKGILLSVGAGLIIAFYYGLLVRSLDNTFVHGGAGSMMPFTAVVFFAIGVFISTFPLNAIFMMKPVEGKPVHIREYFKQKDFRTHFAGILGGSIWMLGITTSFMALGVASPAIAYALSNAAPVVASIWGIYIWKEFKEGSKQTNRLLTLMFSLYIIGLLVIIYAKN